MHEVVLRVLRQHHQVADRVRIGRYIDTECVFDGAARNQRMNAGADTADTLRKCPGVTRVTTLQNHFQPAPHVAGRDGVADYVVFVDVDLDTEVTFDAADRINDDALAGVIEREAVRRRDTSHGSPPSTFRE